jgi:hypothetical protein
MCAWVFANRPLAGNRPCLHFQYFRVTACFTCFVRLRSGLANSIKINRPRPQPPTSTQLPCDYDNHMVDRLSPGGGSVRSAGGKCRHVAENQSVGRMQSAGWGLLALLWTANTGDTLLARGDRYCDKRSHEVESL